MSLRFRLSPLTIISTVLFLAAGEVAAGTGPEYVTMMAVAMLAICITYNLLGGLSTIGGVVFTSCALNWLVISQFAKVILFEPADQGLRSPDLTMTVFAVFFLALMAGVYLFAWIRVDLPRPLEPATSAHSGLLYAISFIVGVAATYYITNLILEHPELADSTGHGLGRAFSMLLPLSLVLAVDHRIRKTEGRHCLGWTALLSTFAMEFFGFIGATRKGFVEPVLLVLVTCYFRGFQFRRRHYIAVVAMVVLLFAVVSPFYLWIREYRYQPSVAQRTVVMGRLLAKAPEHWQDVEAAVQRIQKNVTVKGAQYYSRPGTVTLNRFALMEPDSEVIGATSHYHWGLKTVILDIESALPHFIYPNKPEITGAWYRGLVGGLESSEQGNMYVTTTIVSDAWGAFGWTSLVAVPLLLIPLLFVVYDSMFDMSRPWGTVSTVALVFASVAGGVGVLIIRDLIEIPLYVLLISWFVGWIARYIPMSGESRGRSDTPLFRPQGLRDSLSSD